MKKDPSTRRADALATRHCPECGDVPGDPCVLLPIAPAGRYIRSHDVQARQDMTGQPTKRPHNARLWTDKQRLQHWLRLNGAMFWGMGEK